MWNALGPGSVAYALTELLDNLPEDAVDRALWCLATDPNAPHQYDRAAIPKFLFRALCKARIPIQLQARLATHSALRSIKAGDIVYAWPVYDLELIKGARERGATVVAERTNCMDSTGRALLSKAYARRGLPLPDGWFTPESIEKERDQMLACDFVTAANDLVERSLEDVGVPREKIVQTSYGFNPARLAGAIGIDRPDRPAVFAFVGSGIVRKGLDVLLEAWERADVRGSLLIAGHIDDDIRQSYDRILSRPEVKELGFVKDIASVYAAADVFVFPTHEEGGPQVIYEACGCGLASIVSPMGAGRIARHEIECLVIDPLDVDDLAAALTRLADDEALRKSLATAALDRSKQFTWAKTGMRLYEQFSAIAKRGGPIDKPFEAL